MHGAYGALTVLVKRQQSEKFRKAQMRAKLKSRKESYLDAYDSKDEFDFPEISTIEMRKLKDQIRKDFRREKIKNVFYFLVSILLVSSLVIYVYLKTR